MGNFFSLEFEKTCFLEELTFGPKFKECIEVSQVKNAGKERVSQAEGTLSAE